MPASVRLPVLGLLGQALRDVFGNLGGLVRIAWPYYALAAASAVAGYALSGGSALGDMVASVLGPGTASILTSLAVLACTVTWQRHVVLGEPLRGIAPLTPRVFRYFLWSVLISLLCALPILAAFSLAYGLGLVGEDPSGEAPFRIGLSGHRGLPAGRAGRLPSRPAPDPGAAGRQRRRPVVDPQSARGSGPAATPYAFSPLYCCWVSGWHCLAPGSA